MATRRHDRMSYLLLLIIPAMFAALLAAKHFEPEA
jgi:hypothetical protein